MWVRVITKWIGEPWVWCGKPTDSAAVWIPSRRPSRWFPSDHLTPEMCSSSGSRASRPSPDRLQLHPGLVQTMKPSATPHQLLITHETVTLPVSPLRETAESISISEGNPTAASLSSSYSHLGEPCVSFLTCAVVLTCNSCHANTTQEYTVTWTCCRSEQNISICMNVNKVSSQSLVRSEYFTGLVAIFTVDWFLCFFVDCCSCCLLSRRGMVRWVWWLCWRDNSRFSIFSLIYFETTSCKYPLNKFQNSLVYIYLSHGERQRQFHMPYLVYL